MKPRNKRDSNDGEEDIYQKDFKDGAFKIWALIRS